MIDEHPIIAPLYGIGIPAWFGLLIAGGIGAVILGLAAAVVLTARWRHERA